MSAFSGPQHRGAMKVRRAHKKADAEERQVEFNIEVEGVAHKHNISTAEARYVLMARRNLTRRMAER